MWAWLLELFSGYATWILGGLLAATLAFGFWQYRRADDLTALNSRLVVANAAQTVALEELKAELALADVILTAREAEREKIGKELQAAKSRLDVVRRSDPAAADWFAQLVPPAVLQLLQTGDGNPDSSSASDAAGRAAAGNSGPSLGRRD